MLVLLVSGGEQYDWKVPKVHRRNWEREVSILKLANRYYTESRVWVCFWSVCIFQGFYNQVPHTGWLTQEKCVVSPFWRLGVESKCLQLGSFRGLWGRTCFMLLPELSCWWFGGHLCCSLACRYITASPPSCSHRSLCVCVCVRISPFCKDTGHMRLGASL